uniref:Uncharacterized protein n=1 Tax=Anguilla anguilla TaxID=7936 RepID=A0A0E9WM12_ANGAN
MTVFQTAIPGFQWVLAVSIHHCRCLVTKKRLVELCF